MNEVRQLFHASRCSKAAVVLGVLLACALPAVATAGEDHPATATVEALHEQLLICMQADGADVQARREILRETMAQSFDVAAIARVSVGRHWRTFTPEQREQLTDTLFDLILTTYAARFSGYSGERFVTVGSGEAPPGQALVHTRIERSGADPVRLDYLLRETDDSMRIFNVIANGFSDLSVRRAEYTSIIERSGFDALIREMERLIERNLGGSRG